MYYNFQGPHDNRTNSKLLVSFRVFITAKFQRNQFNILQAAHRGARKYRVSIQARAYLSTRGASSIQYYVYKSCMCILNLVCSFMYNLFVLCTGLQLYTYFLCTVNTSLQLYTYFMCTAYISLELNTYFLCTLCTCLQFYVYFVCTLYTCLQFYVYFVCTLYTGLQFYLYSSCKLYTGLQFYLYSFCRLYTSLLLYVYSTYVKMDCGRKSSYIQLLINH